MVDQSVANLAAGPQIRIAGLVRIQNVQRAETHLVHSCIVVVVCGYGGEKVQSGRVYECRRARSSNA